MVWQWIFLPFAIDCSAVWPYESSRFKWRSPTNAVLWNWVFFLPYLWLKLNQVPVLHQQTATRYWKNLPFSMECNEWLWCLHWTLALFKQSFWILVQQFALCWVDYGSFSSKQECSTPTLHFVGECKSTEPEAMEQGKLIELVNIQDLRNLEARWWTPWKWVKKLFLIQIT